VRQIIGRGNYVTAFKMFNGDDFVESWVFIAQRG
jgi:hypothetical protein